MNAHCTVYLEALELLMKLIPMLLGWWARYMNRIQTRAKYR